MKNIRTGNAGICNQILSLMGITVKKHFTRNTDKTEQVTIWKKIHKNLMEKPFWGCLSTVENFCGKEIRQGILGLDVSMDEMNEKLAEHFGAVG